MLDPAHRPRRSVRLFASIERIRPNDPYLYPVFTTKEAAVQPDKVYPREEQPQPEIPGSVGPGVRLCPKP